MIEDYVIVLGSGESINYLSEAERHILDSGPVKISINKYAAFCNLAKIYPTHIFFTDDYYESGRSFFRFMVGRIKQFWLEDLIFIISKRASEYLILYKENFFSVYFKKIAGDFICHIENTVLSLENKYPIFKKMYSKLFRTPKEHLHKFVIMPKRSKLHVASIASYSEWGGLWAKSLDETIYHYKGSLSSVLNYVSIFFPNKKVILVGVDFNTPDYFYENELSKIRFNTRDWTYELRKKEKKHYSIIETDGKKIDDVFPYMIEQLGKTGNVVYSINQKSYLVEKGFVEHIQVNDL